MSIKLFLLVFQGEVFWFGLVFLSLSCFVGRFVFWSFYRPAWLTIGNRIKNYSLPGNQNELWLRNSAWHASKEAELGVSDICCGTGVPSVVVWTRFHQCVLNRGEVFTWPLFHTGGEGSIWFLGTVWCFDPESHTRRDPTRTTSPIPGHDVDGKIVHYSQTLLP